MELYSCHNSREAVYRSPQGALKTGTEAVLRLRLWGADASHADTALRIWLDGREDMIAGEPENIDGRLYHSYRFTAPNTPQLLWYYFVIDVHGERRFYGGRTGEGRPSGTRPQDYQITVYDAAYETPEWFREGVIYQILPDRFHRGAPDKDGRTALDRLDYHEKLGRRIVRHEDWSEPVLHLPVEGEKYYMPCDHFGGDLKGVTEKLDYLASLGVTCIYLNPIFDAASNHRYNTGNYLAVDPALGSEEDLKELNDEAAKRGMRLMLDGVFSHTGDDSVYFNRYGNYPSNGAYQSTESPYYEWYEFKRWPDKYRCWWGFETLPEVNEEKPSYIAFVRGVLEKWAKLGPTSWRLDVADELPDSFIEALRTAVKALDPSGVLLGEVWDDASNKMWAKGLRRYVYGYELDSVMNYPFRDAVIAFFTGESDARDLLDALGGQRERYPEPFYRACMNTLGSHDTQRILSVLAGAPNKDLLSRAQQARFRHSEEALKLGKRRLLSAVCLQFTMPQPPCIFYGDEAGMSGLSDPFNRGTYPWGHEDKALLERCRILGELRTELSALKRGETVFLPVGYDCFAVWRRFGNETVLTVVNRASEEREIGIHELDFTEGPDAENVRFADVYQDRLSGREYQVDAGKLDFTLPPLGAAVLLGWLDK